LVSHAAGHVKPEGPAGDDSHSREPTKHYGIGAVNYHTGETVVLLKRHKRRKEIATERHDSSPSKG
jgi:hypothetical protein